MGMTLLVHEMPLPEEIARLTGIRLE